MKKFSTPIDRNTLVHVVRDTKGHKIGLFVAEREHSKSPAFKVGFSKVNRSLVVVDKIIIPKTGKTVEKVQPIDSYDFEAGLDVARARMKEDYFATGVEVRKLFNADCKKQFDSFLCRVISYFNER